MTLASGLQEEERSTIATSNLDIMYRIGGYNRSVNTVCPSTIVGTFTTKVLQRTKCRHRHPPIRSVHLNASQDPNYDNTDSHYYISTSRVNTKLKQSSRLCIPGKIQHRMHTLAFDSNPEFQESLMRMLLLSHNLSNSIVLNAVPGHHSHFHTFNQCKSHCKKLISYPESLQAESMLY